MKQTIDCPLCAGGGKSGEADCAVCQGSGNIAIEVVAHKTISIRQQGGDRCTIWQSTGEHVINEDGLCRCGRRFLLVEVTQP